MVYSLRAFPPNRSMNPFSLKADLTNFLNEEAVIGTVPMVERLKNDGEPPF